MNKIYNVGLIGFSIGGRVFHAPFIKDNPELKLYKVTARTDARREELSKFDVDAIPVDDAQQLFDDPKVDIVVIATSNDVHYSFAKSAIHAGKHVVVEKPFTNTVEEADELISLAKEKGVTLTVHHNARFHSDFKTVKEMIGSNRLGRLVNYEARYDRFRNYLREGAWRERDLPGSGIHYDLGAHLIDQSLQLFGHPDAVFSDLRVQRDGAHAVDDFEIILYYPRLKVSLKGQMLAKEATARYALYGTNGSFVKWGTDPQEELLRNGVQPSDFPDWGSEPQSIWGQLSVTDDGVDVNEKVPSAVGSGQDFYNNLVTVLKANAELLVTPQQARDVIFILQSAEKSNAERRVVSLIGKLIS